MSKSTKLKFNTISSAEIKLSDDRLSACRKISIDGSNQVLVFSDQCLSFKEDFQIQIIEMTLSQFESLQFGIVTENPLNLNNNIAEKDANLKNSLSLRKNVLYHQNDENVITSEEYDLNLSEICEGDLIGIRITENGELHFTYNGVAHRKAADNLPKNIWAFVNLNSRCSFISIIPSNGSISLSHKEKMILKLKDTPETCSSNRDEEMSFHNFCGKEVILADDNRVAKRKNPTNEFRNAVVISNRALVTEEMFRLRIEGLINKWNGSLELGVTFHNPDMFDLPTAMNNLRSGTLVLSGNSILTNGHGTRLPYCTTSLDDLKIGDEIGIVRKSNGNVHFFINNDDMGVAANIPVEKDIWVIADLYGRTIKVSIINDTTKALVKETNTNSELDIECGEDTLIFHGICGKNVRLNDDRTRACRINDQEFNNGVVFTHRPLKIGEKWAVKLVRCVEQWAGNMEVGLTTKCPTNDDIPSTMTDVTTGYSIMLTSNGLVVNGSPLSTSTQRFDPEDIHPILSSGILSLTEGNILGVELLENLEIRFYLNGADLGVITIEAEEELYGVIDLYGKAAEVCLCSHDPYNHDNGSDLFGKYFNSTINDDNQSEIDSSFHYQTLLYTEENNDFGRGFSLLQSESGLCDALKEADRSFLRLLSGSDDLNVITTDVNAQPLVFHHAHGRNVFLSNDGRTAYRPSPNNEFKNALVMSSRPLGTDEIFEICVDKMTDHWSGSLEMGVTLNNPGDLNFPGTLSQLDKDCWILSGSCIMNNGITARNDYSLDMDTITVNSKIGLIRRHSGMLHFLFNGKDMGAAYFDVPSGVFAILDLYGQCSKVSLTSRSGTCLSNDQSTGSFLETSDSSSLAIRQPDHVLQSSDIYNRATLGPSRLSPFERVMLVFKENISGLSEDDGVNISTRRSDLDGQECRASFDDDDPNIQMFNGDNIFGDGVRWSESHGFKAENQKRNCIIQSKYPLKPGIYHEFLFYTSKDQNQNYKPISFGFTAEKFGSQRSLPVDLFQLNPPTWILVGNTLFVDNKLFSLNLGIGLAKLKKRLLIGLYLHENNTLEVFSDRNRVGLLELFHHNYLYMLLDLNGWYDSFMSSDLLQRGNIEPTLVENIIQRPLSSYSLKNEMLTDDNIMSTVGPNVLNDMDIAMESLDIEDPIMIGILKELYELLPLFMISLKGIETSRLVERIVVSNNDIVVSIKRDIEMGRKQNFVKKHNIRNRLISELSKRFSYLTDLKDLGNSPCEIARVLRRQVLIHAVKYDGNAKAFVVPDSRLHLDDSSLFRSQAGCEFGLGIINQDLKSEKYKAYEIHLSNPNSTNELSSGSTNNNISVGLILIETKHFRRPEDAFKFLLSIPSPKHIRSISNHINLQLGLFESESTVLVVVVENDSVLLNGHQICQGLPFNISSMTSNQFIQLKLRESETAFNDVYLSVRTTDTSSNYLILSRSSFDSCSNISTISSEVTDYFYIPFVWLNHKISISITAASTNISQSLLGSNQTDRREWLEKHYNDELNKESNQTSVSDQIDSNERQCLSLKRAALVKMSLSLPETYFKSKSAVCFCNSCRTPTSGSANLTTETCDVLIKGDPAKEFRLPLGWVKYNIRLKREVRCCLSLWHLGYLTVSPVLIHRLLASPDTMSFLKFTDHSLSPDISWLTTKSLNDCVPGTRLPIVISPWQPLIGGYINEDKFIKSCVEAQVNCYEPHSRTDTVARVALEVRVKPHTYQSMEYKVICENTSEEKSTLVRDPEAGQGKKSAEITSPRSINPKTVWILNGEANSLVISGLLIKIV